MRLANLLVDCLIEFTIINGLGKVTLLSLLDFFLITRLIEVPLLVVDKVGSEIVIAQGRGKTWGN